ncbi:MAG: protein translocase subunit SecD [Planctomycetota bacterium]
MPKLVWKALVLLVVFGILGLALANNPLRKGIDLAGGSALIYDVSVPADKDTEEVIDQTIGVLRDRVDPTGTKNLVWRRVAGNRIEIQMPAPDPRVRQLEQAFEAALAAALVDNLDASLLDQALAKSGQDRAEALAQLAGADADRLAQLEALAELYDQRARAEQAYDAVEAQYAQVVDDPGAAAADRTTATRELEAAIDRRFQARRAYQSAESELLGQNLTPLAIEQALLLSDKPPRQREGQPQRPSPRSVALDRLKAQAPARTAQIDAVAVAWVDYSANKGPLEDVNDLKNLLRGSGMLEMRIAPRPDAALAERYGQQLAARGPRAGAGNDYRWFVVDDLEQFIDEPEDRERLLDIRDELLTTTDASVVGPLQAEVAQAFVSRRLMARHHAGDFYVLLGNRPGVDAMTGEQDWEVRSVGRTQDELGRPALLFSVDKTGEGLLAGITGPNIGEIMAVLLDGRVITAPNLNDELSTGGTISGSFSQAELAYMIRSMQAGSLEGQLSPEPISEKTTGPSLGKDNLDRGFRAALLALVLVAAFMLVYYLFIGAVADLALAANMLMILGVMAAIQSTFTLPGIAGLVLTIGMAVDANVLIFERIREELEAGEDLQVAVKQGFAKALSTILDANLTTLITCFVLGFTATAEIKGFAVVLGIGIVCTLFTALFMSRVFIQDLAVDALKFRGLPMLPTMIPAVRRLLSPKVDWVGLRFIFIPISMALLIIGLGTAAYRGADLLDIEFRAGTAVTFELKDGAEAPLTDARQRLAVASSAAAKFEAAINDPSAGAAQLNAQESALADAIEPIVQASIRRHADELAAYQAALDGGVQDPPSPGDAPDFAALAEDVQSNVVTVGEVVDTPAGPAFGEFTLNTLMTDADAVAGVIKAAFGDDLEAAAPIRFAGDDIVQVADAGAVAQRVDVDSLTEVLGRAPLDAAEDDITPFLGGAVFVFERLNPPASIEQVTEKIERQVRTAPHDDLPYRDRRVVALESAPGVDADGRPLYAAVAVVVSEPNAALESDGEEGQTEDVGNFAAAGGLADTEWSMLRDAMGSASSLKGVTRFSSQISGTMRNQAIVAMLLSLLAVVVYIWFRFGSFRYGFAAIVALVHDVSLALGLLAVSGWVADQGWAQAILLDPFKIDLAIIAALLTIVGYSLNDTIVVFDRIRENRGKLSYATAEIINRSINQTVSRTVLTSGTTFMAVSTLYFLGGPGVHGFAFAMLIGVVVGTYSSVAVAAPLLMIGAKDGKVMTPRHGGPPTGSPPPARKPSGPSTTPALPA